MANPQLMEFLWQRAQHTGDGQHVTFVPADITWLWHTGFVDTARVPFATWQAFFAPFEQPDGSFKLSEADFFGIDQFRYTGIIHAPFDFNLINEGKYTAEGLQELFTRGIAPSLNVTSVEFNQFIATFKTEFKEPDGLIRMDALGKAKIGAWIDANPSPLRNLELIMDALYKNQELDPEMFLLPEAKTQQQIAAIQSTAFSMMPSSKATAKREALGKITQSKAAPTVEDPQKPTIPLHKLKRPRTRA